MAHSAKPENITWLSPYITVRDADAAAKFYEAAFKFKLQEAIPGDDGSTWHAELMYKDQLIMLGKEGGYDKTVQAPISSDSVCPMSLYLYCENVDTFFAAAISAGAKEIMPPQDMFWGDRMCKLQDLDGYIWSFATFLGERT